MSASSGRDSGPEDARAARGGEEAEPRELKLDGTWAAGLVQHGADALGAIVRRLADELQCDVRAFDAHPAPGG